VAAGGEAFDLGASSGEPCGESGLELLRHFKSNYPNLPIIIYTGLGNGIRWRGRCAEARTAFCEKANRWRL